MQTVQTVQTEYFFSNTWLWEIPFTDPKNTKIKQRIELPYILGAKLRQFDLFLRLLLTHIYFRSGHSN